MAIAITVDTASNNITVAPTAAYFHPGDTISWESNASSLTLTFKDTSPFDTMQVTGGAAAQATVPANSPKGCTYHYSVAALVNGTIYVIPGCPEIIIQ